MLKLYFHPFKIKWNAVCLVFKSKDLPALFKTLLFCAEHAFRPTKGAAISLYGCVAAYFGVVILLSSGVFY